MKQERTYNIYCLFREWVLVPDNAIENAFYKRHPNDAYLFKTADGVVVRPEFVATYNHAGGMNESSLDRTAKGIWNMSLEQVKSVWLSRLTQLGDYWHLIRLEKV